MLSDGKTLPRAREAAARLRAGLDALQKKHPDQIEQVRGMGLLLGVVLKDPERAKAVAAAALEHGLLLNVTADRVLRIAPPLVVTDAQIDEGLAILGRVFAS